MAKIVLKNIKKVYENGYTAVHDFSLEIKENEFVILVGPSGCGKSTTLRMIAGLEDISTGELFINGRLVNDVAPKDRDIAMVFQNYALYPHMTVFKNMAFALEMQKLPKSEIKKKVTDAAKSLDIENLLDRKPRALSGGQRQRVALGRAMVRNPSVFLLDEPLSNLDAKLRTQMRTEIKNLHHKLGTTFIYVTHDQTEAMTMGDRIVVMKDGYIQQVDTPQNLYTNPCNSFVAGFIGSPQMNFLTGTVEEENGNVYFVSGEQRLSVAQNAVSDGLKNCFGKSVILGIRPEDMKVKSEFSEDENILSGKILITELMGDSSYIHIEIGKDKTICKYNSLFSGKNGSEIFVNPDMSKCMFFDKDTGVRL